MGRLSRVAGCNQSHKISCQRHVSWLPSVSAMPQQPGNAWNNQQDRQQFNDIQRRTAS